MKRLVAAITCLAFTGSVAFAQQEGPAPPPPPEPAQQPQPTYAYPPPQQPTYAYPPEQQYPGCCMPPARALPTPEQMYRSGRRQRAVGMLLTVLGIGFGILGAAMLNDSQHSSTFADYDDNVLEGLYGFLFTMIGIGSFVPGLVLWVHGESKMDDALHMGANGMTLAPTPRVAAAPGLTLQWTF